MDGATFGIIAAALTGLGGLILSLVTLVKNSKDKDEEQSETHRVNEFDIMERTIAVLRQNLDDAERRVAELLAQVEQARAETQALRQEATIALANVAILSQHIRDHVTDGTPFPLLRTAP